MTKKITKKLQISSKSNEQDYEVGYAKPPISKRFKPGISGNPSGRPRGAKNKQSNLSDERLKQIILDEAYRNVAVNDGGKRNSISMAEAVMRSIAVNAAKGEHRAQKMFIELLDKTETSRKERADELLNIAIDYKQSWENTLEKNKLLKIHEPEPLPHPDDIIIDMKTGKVTIHGPITREEKIEWDKNLKRLRECEKEIVSLQAMSEDPKHRGYLNVIKENMIHEMKIRDILKEFLGDYAKRNN